MDLASLYGNLPLDATKDEIRLVVLHKRSDQSSENLIDYELIRVSLNSNPSYLALSYVWGPEGNEETILVNGTKVAVRRNLHEALEQIQSTLTTDGQYSLWTDAICINQSDLLEKKDQIPKMGRIFQSAQMVFAYLGPEKDNCHLVFEECNKAGMETFFYALMAAIDRVNGTTMYQDAKKNRALFMEFAKEVSIGVSRQPHLKNFGIQFLDIILHDKDMLRDLANGVKLLESGPDSDNCTAWESFCRRDFWTRVWILQELALGKDVVLQAGSKMTRTKLEYFLAVFCLCDGLSRNLRKTSESARDTTLLLAHVYGNASSLIHCLIECKKAPRDLDTLIFDSQQLEAEKNVDKIYALLGLAADTTELDIQADYKKSFEENCLELAKLLVIKRGVSAFTYCRKAVDCSKMPSWANIYCLLKHDWQPGQPQYKRPERKLSPMSNDRIVFDLKFSACRALTQSLDKASFLNSTKLMVKAISVSDVFQIRSVNFDSSEYHIQGGEADVRAVRRVLQILDMFAGDDVRDRENLWWVPILHRDPQTRPSDKNINYPGFHQELHESYKVLANISDSALNSEVLDKTEFYRRLLRNMVSGQAFFTTRERSYVGMGSSKIQGEDKIVIFPGGQMPFALRPTGKGTYRLLGEVYVLGIMHGEFLEKDPPIVDYVLE